jgi:ATP phosphoribosyltransferase
MLQLGLPKGSLEIPTVEMFAKAGWRITLSSRSYYPGIDDDEIECTLVRPEAAILVREWTELLR